MKLSNTFATIAVSALLATSAQAQEAANFGSTSGTYSTAIGLRGGHTSGLTIKHFVGSSFAIEGILGLWRNGLSATVLAEKHVAAFGVNGMNWYYGGGGHVTVHNNDYFRNYYGRKVYYTNGQVGIGVDGILGLEYKIPAIPFAISLDVKPFIEVNSGGGVGGAFDGALGIKVAF